MCRVLVLLLDRCHMPDLGICSGYSNVGSSSSSSGGDGEMLDTQRYHIQCLMNADRGRLFEACVWNHILVKRTCRLGGILELFLHVPGSVSRLSADQNELGGTYYISACWASSGGISPQVPSEATVNSRVQNEAVYSLSLLNMTKSELNPLMGMSKGRFLRIRMQSALGQLPPEFNIA